MRDLATAHLHSIAGPDAEFRDGQWEAIEAIAVNHGRALVVQRTGWGKSAVYLIATRLLRDQGRGPTVIVSPLLALMRNQIAMAERVGISAVTVNSTNRDDWEEIFGQIAADEIDLLLISPERLNNPAFLADVFPRLSARMGLLVVDEAHCISDWGHDFRPDYRRLSRVVAALPPTVPVLGTTATANDRVVRDVAEQMGSGLAVFRGPLERESLRLDVIPMPNKAERLAWLAEALPNLPGAGIVYCLTIKDAERVGLWLRERGIEARTYTGETDPEIRLEIEDALSAGELKTVVATSALGMGYDNPFIEYVIHFQSPGSPVSYYQQVGRAGRAVPHAAGILLIGAEDREIQDYFINTAFPPEEQTSRVLGVLAEGPSTIRELESAVNIQRSKLTGLLKILEVEQAVYREGSRWHRSADGWDYPRQRVEGVLAERRRERDAMVDYAKTEDCLMQFLRHQLDDHTAEPCGRCARCTETSVLDITIAEDTRAAALEFLRRSHLPIEPRKQWPERTDLGKLLTYEEGRALSAWGDPGWAESVRRAVFEETPFGDGLVDGIVSMIRAWDPQPSPTWVTAIPSSSDNDPVTDVARRIADKLSLPFVPAIRRVRQRPPQTTLQNSVQQFRNVLNAFTIESAPTGPVLVIDDMVDSRWTFTMIGHLLRAAGVEAVFPVALVDTSNRQS